MSARLEVGSLAPNSETDPAGTPETSSPAAAVLQGVRIGGDATIAVTQYLNPEPAGERMVAGERPSQRRGAATGTEWERPGQQGPDVVRPWVRSALRRDLSTFVGRDTELQQLVDAASWERVVSVHAVDGMAGVGKTALVTRAAHMLADGFPDGRYFVEFNAHAPGLAPADPFHVLATLLTHIGVDPGRVPDSLASRRDLWRDRLEGRRVLLVFDDVLDLTQIEPLLPPGGDSLVLITSRRRLIGLDGAIPLPLDSLDPDAAVQVFWSAAHRRPARADAAAAAQIVRLCGYLPLAIVLLAGRLAHHRAWKVADLAAELSTTHDRLSELDVGQRAVRAAFTTSYRALSPRRQQMFRRLGLHPGPDLDVYAAAAIAEMPVAQARRHLEAIYIDHLIEETTPGRYRFHDLLREFARDLADTDPVEDTDRAVERLMVYYTHASRRVARPSPAPQHGSLHAAASPEVPTPSTDVTALEWMRAERPNLLACLAHAASTNQLPHVIGLTGALAEELRLHGYWQLGVAISQRFAVAGHTISDSNAEAFALKDLAPSGYLADGYVVAAGLLQQQLTHHRHLEPTMRTAALRCLAKACVLAGDYRATVTALQQALVIARETGNRSSEGSVLNNLGWVHHNTGDYRAAIGHIRQALAIQVEQGNGPSEANARMNLGWALCLQGDHAAAVKQGQWAEAIYHDRSRRSEQAHALAFQAWVSHLMREYSQSETLAARAIELYRAIGSRSGEAFILNHFSWVRILRGDYTAAADMNQQALALYEQLGNRSGVASALNSLGRVRSLLGDHASAADLIQQSLTIYEGIGNRAGEAEALANLGWVRHGEGHQHAAGDQLHRALTIFQAIDHRLGQAETLNRIGTHLAGLGNIQQALATYDHARRLASRIHCHLELARALEGTARCLIHTGERSRARTALGEAIPIYQHLGAAETHSAAALLERINTAHDNAEQLNIQGGNSGTINFS